MKLERFTYLLAFVLLIVFTSDLQGQFRRKKVKLSDNNKIEEFINDYIQDPFMVQHIQALQSELVKIGFEILPPDTDGNVEIEILFLHSHQYLEIPLIQRNHISCFEIQQPKKYLQNSIRIQFFKMMRYLDQ